MSFLKRLESRLDRWAIPNITGIIIAGQVLLYFGRTFLTARNAGADPLTQVTLVPSKVVGGEIWRLISFPFVPPDTVLLWAAISWMIFYHFGTSLEREWGAVRYNIFLAIGCLANVAASFIAWGVGSDVVASNAFLYGTVFLAFARIFPNFVLHVFFVLPIQIKWLALLMWINYAYQFLTGDGTARMLIVASVLNYLAFFGREHWRQLKQGQRRRSYQARTSQAAKKVAHACRVCGLSSDDAPRTLFRYCSKCSGQACYCPEHIHDHEHVLAGERDASDSALADSAGA